MMESLRLEEAFKAIHSSHAPSSATVTPGPLNHITRTRSSGPSNMSRDGDSATNLCQYLTPDCEKGISTICFQTA